MAKTYAPKELALELGVDPKVLRSYLRSNHTRKPEAKNQSWVIPTNVANDARKHFAKNVATEPKAKKAKKSAPKAADVRASVERS
jgi:hypothetical protein